MIFLHHDRFMNLGYTAGAAVGTSGSFSEQRKTMMANATTAAAVANTLATNAGCIVTVIHYFFP
jgi:hypothetical protein